MTRVVQRPFRYSPPPSPVSLIRRPRLVDVLSRRFDIRVVAIEAGAGLGKTTLLAQAVAQGDERGRDVWLTCEPGDGSASTLLGALLDALDAPGRDAPPSVEQVCEAVWSASPAHVCLVLDDVHALEDGSTGQEALRLLMENLPANGHVVIAGRSLAAIPRARLLLHEQAVELTEDDLRLDDAETAAFAAAHGVPLEVVERASGWAALASLYARTGTTDADRFAWEEVVTRLPAADRHAFLLTVAVGGGDAEMLEAAVGCPFDRARLAELPLVSADDHGGLRPHRLWERVVEARIERAEVIEARRRVAALLVERGEPGRAFELLAGSGDWERALPSLFDACNAQRHPPWRDEMARWRLLVPESLRGSAEAVYLDAMIERERDAWSPLTRPLFLEAMHGFRERGDVRSEVAAAIRATAADWLRADADGLREIGDRGRQLIAAGIPLHSIIALNEATLAEIDGRGDDVRALLSEVGDVEPRLRHVPPVLRAFARLAEGAAGAAVADAADAADAASPIAPAAITGWAALLPVAVAWANGDLVSALAAPPLDPGPRYAVAERVPALALAAVVAAHTGDVTSADAHVAAIDALVPALEARDLLAGFRAVAAAAAAVAAGEEERARHGIGVDLADRALTPAGAGRAVRWLPTLPYLLHEPSREVLDSLASGPARRRALDACRALLDARDGAVVATDLLEDVNALLTALPAPLVVELVVRAAGDAPTAVHVGCVAAVADVAPGAVREALRRLADGGAPRVSSAATRLLATVPIPPPNHIRIEVLGPARLLRDGVVVDDADWRRQRVRQLVCALVALREIRRDRLGTLLWPEFDEKGVSANLRMTLSYVQGLLEPSRASGDAPWFLQQSSGVLRLRADEHLRVDAWEVEAALADADDAAAAGSTSAELAHLLTAVGLCRGEYLDDVAGEEWAGPLRERFRQRFVRGAVRAGDLLVAAARFSEAIRVGDVALSADPWCEAAMRLGVRARIAAGDRTGALQAYEAGLGALMELGISPEPATDELGIALRG